MRVKAFLLLPETDAAFEMLHQNPDSYREIITQLFAIKQKLKAQDGFHVYYDSANISKFIQAATGYIPDPHLAGIKGQLYHILKYISTDVNLPVFRNYQHVYANWQISVSVLSSPFVVAESAESKIADNDNEKTICLCLGNSLNSERDELHVIKDSIGESSLPVLITIGACSCDVSFVRWVVTLPIGKFSLRINQQYEPLEKFWKKERIYRHKATGNHWYFDFFHKDNKIHYEVFDSTGDVYLGEADENGNMKPGTNVGNRKISNII